MKSTRLFAAVALLILGSSAPVLAWGGKGHTIVNHLAALGFAGRMPAFLTSQAGVFELSYLGPEMDRLKGSGASWDGDYDPGHYVDLQDDGTIAGALQAANMPKDRELYDTALRAAQTDQYRQGFLPYEILDGWEQLRQDFAYWRVYDYDVRHDSLAAASSTARRDRDVMERAVAQDLGVWGHFVGDGSQPLHVSVHFNGWGEFPNPDNFTQSRETHAMFESDFVDKYVAEPQVAALVKPSSSLPVPAALLSQEDVMSAIMTYLETSNRTVPQLYQIEKRGGFASGSAEARAFTASRLAAGAAELRDLSVWAWQDSAFASVGYPAVSVRNVLLGKAVWPPPQGE